MPTDPFFYLIGLPSIFLIALGKGAFGGGLAILGIPLLALIVDPVSAAIMVAVLVSPMDLFALRAFPSNTWSKPDLKWLIPGMLVGLAAGTLFFVAFDPRFVALGIGVITVAFAIRYFLSDQSTPARPAPVSPLKALGLSTISGFTTFVAHAGGPPIAMYLLGRGLNKTLYAGTNIALFTISNALKLIPYLWLGSRHPDALWKALVLAPVIPLGVIVGKALHDRLDEKQIYRYCYMLVGAAGLKLAVESIVKLAE